MVRSKTQKKKVRDVAVNANDGNESFVDDVNTLKTNTHENKSAGLSLKFWALVSLTVAAAFVAVILDVIDLGRNEIKLDDEVELSVDHIIQSQKIEDKFSHETHHESSSNFAEIVEWMESYGATFPNVELKIHKNTDEHRGVVARRNIAEGEIIMKIPSMFVITAEKARESPIGKLLSTAIKDEIDSEQLYIAFFLLEERSLGDASWWQPYINTLPTMLRNFPVNYDESELAMMEGSLTAVMQKADLQELKTHYALIVSKLPDLGVRFDFEAYRWARLIAMSRAFSLTVNGVEQSALMPYADMINHEFKRDTTWQYRDDIGAGTLDAVEAIKKGTELSISYGNKGNERLLSYYGFAVDNNEHNEAVVYIGLKDGDKLLHEKMLRAKNPEAEFYRLFFKLSVSSEHESFRTVMSLCRLAVANEHELNNLPIDGHHLPFSATNERAALLYLQFNVELALSKFAGTIELDQALLVINHLSFNQRNIVRTRLGEKNVLLDLINMIDMVLPLIDAPSLAVYNRVRIQPKYSAFRSYLRDVAIIHRNKDFALAQDL